MNTKNLILVFTLLWISSLSLSAQVLISVNKTITQDTLLTNIQRNSLSSKTVNVSGQAEFFFNSGYVRILLSDDYGYDLLVYESSPLIAVNGIDNFNNMSIESVNIPAHLELTKVRVEIKNAKLKNLSVIITETNISKIQQQQTRTDRIALMNSNLRSRNALWIVGETSISQMSYQEKKGLFGEKIPDLQGFEYYKGGVFELHSDSTVVTKNTQKTTRSPYISYFDWRNRHGRNWITPAKDQGGCGSCAIFASVGNTEAYTNLYYNRLLNLDLSEQELLSCSGPNCSGGLINVVYNYLKGTGIVNESCFEYVAYQLPCNNNCSNPSERIKIGGYTDFSPVIPDDLRRQVLKSPISINIRSWNHAMVLVGYKTIEIGDQIDGWGTINVGHPLIGTDAWSVKNSWGTDWGENGFAYIIVDMSDIGNTHSLWSNNVTSINYSNTDIVCEDRDGDGYYFWGIGPKPATCPACAPNEPDGDDSNPNLGPMDEYGNCAAITPLVENITTSQTWSTNRTLCKNIAIQSGVTLTITATVFSSNHVITIKNGGKLILSGGTIDNGYIVAQNGSELTITNNGKVLLGNYNDLDIQLGAVFNLEYGEISLK